MERSILVKATRDLLRIRPYSEVSLAAILEQSGLHTRAFYRHFETKDDVLRAIYRDNGEELGRIVTRRVEDAATSADGVAAWIDEILRLRFDERSVAYRSIYDDPTAREVLAITGEPDASKSLILKPLVEVLEAGIADGSFVVTEPAVHASFIWALAWSDLDRLEPLPKVRRKAQAEALEKILRFSMSALTGAHRDRA
jgi:AcrR family transcriptional regulator